MYTVVDADMIGHEVGHLRVNEKDKNGKDILDDDGKPIKGDLLPLETVVEIAKGRLLSIIMGAQAGGWKAYLTKGRHYRHDLATILPYKGHRDGAERNNVDHVKDALHTDLGAIWCTDNEADDAMATEQWQDIVSVGSEFGWEDENLRHYSNVVIATRDKDLDTVPGWKFKWWLKGVKDASGVEIPEEKRKVEKGEAYWVSVTQAFRNFYTQMLTGDSADNIKGLYGVGKKSTWVKQVQEMDEEEDMYEHVEEKYLKHFGPNYGPKFLRETAMLLHMQRRVDDEWLPPDERDEHYWFL
jgi:hypothetical protein